MIDKEWLQRRALQAAPLEACGFVMENGDIIEIRNISLAPRHNFKMDRVQLVEKIRDRVDFIAGIWHTHPSGILHPSHEDLEAIKLGAIQPNWDYYIVTRHDVAMYQTKLYAPVSNDHWLRFGV